MDVKQFEKEIHKTAIECLKHLDMAKIRENVDIKIKDVLVSATMNALGFENRSFNRGWGIPERMNEREGGSLFQKVKEEANKRAEEIMSSIDLSKVELSDADKKAIIEAYKQKRREILTQKAREFAYEDAFELSERVVNEVRKNFGNVKPVPSDKIIDIIFGPENDEEEIDNCLEEA